MAQQRLQTLHLLILFSLTAVIGACQKAAPEREEEVPTANLAELEIDRELGTMFHLMWEKRDSLPYQFADTFEMKLEAALQNPETFSYPFDSLQSAGVRIVESDDHRVRIYWWLHSHTGTMRHYPAIVQAKLDSQRYVVQNMRDEVQEGASFPYIAYHNIYRLQDSMYLALVSGQFSGLLPFEAVHGYVLTDSGLSHDVWMFQSSESDTLLSSIYMDKLWYVRNVEKFDNRVPIVMNYQSELKELQYPEMIDTVDGIVVDNDVHGVLTVRPSGRTIRLKFNGKYFEPVRE